MKILICIIHGNIVGATNFVTKFLKIEEGGGQGEKLVYKMAF